MSIRLGAIPYSVGLPLLGGLDRDDATSPPVTTAPDAMTRRFGTRVEMVYDAPSRLIRELRQGALDAALLSSVEAFRRPGYRLAPRLAICSDGPVGSVRAFRRCAPNGTPVPIRTVAIDDASETSVALLRILLAKRLGATDCEFERVPATMEPDRLPHDLVMLIGDSGQHADPGQRLVLDLGELWREWTGLPFVFAAWLIAPGADAKKICEILEWASRNGADRRVGAPSIPPGIYYDLGSRELQGLYRFRDEAVALGLAEAEFAPELLDGHGDAGRDAERSTDAGS